MSSRDVFLRKAAWNFLIDQKICALPVNSFEIASNLGYEVYSYNDFALLVKKDVNYIIDKYDNAGFVFWSKQKQNFVICYNSNLSSGVIRWTIMHEIAHIVLNHVTPSASLLTRMRKKDRPIFEVEADGFTRRVICPSIILHDCKAFEVAQIMDLCGISRQAAEYRSDHIKVLERRNKFRTDQLEIEVENQFRMFILKYFRKKSMCEMSLEFCFEIIKYGKVLVL